MAYKYISVANELEHDFPRMLRSGITRLPSEAELCSRFCCSRQTVRAALSFLQDQNLIIKCRGSGSYISGAASRGRTVALILPSGTEYIYASTVQIIRRSMEANGLSLSVYSTGGSAFREREILMDLSEDPPAGIIMEAASTPLPCICEDLLACLSEHEVPIVYLNSAYDLPPSATRIASDERSGMYQLVSALSRSGYKRITAIMRANHRPSFERYSGCATACLDVGIGFSESDTLWLSSREYEEILSSDYRVLETLLHPTDERTAFVCCSDELAFHVIKCLTKNGFNVPEDISVTGFDNSYYSFQIRPSLSSVGPENCSPSKEAASAMLALLTGRKTNSQLLPMTVFLRDSTK